MIGRNKIWLLLSVFCMGLFAMVVPGCDQSPLGGTTSSAAKILPEGVSLDISEFPDDDTNPDAAQGAPRVFDRPHERPCKMAGAILHGFHRVHNRGLALAAKLNDDLEDPENPFLEGTITVADQELTYKADFSAFDIDGDATTDGSGRFDTDPVALRMWMVKDTGPERFLCALITTRPTTDNTVGAGQMYHQPGVVHPLVNPDFKSYMIWDHTDETDRWHEAYTVGRLRSNVRIAAGHHKVEVVTLADDSVQKTLRSTSTIDESDFDFTEFKHAARTIRGSGVALFNTEAVGLVTISVTGQCMLLADCDAAEAGACDIINTSDLDYLPAADGTETDWPTDFPEEPTF